MREQTLGPLDLIAQDRKKHPVKPAVYKTPGVECQHATKGCCPRCRAPFPGKMKSRITDNIAGYTGKVKARMYAVSKKRPAKRQKRRVA